MILWAGLNCCTSCLPASLSSSCLRKQGKEDDAVLVIENAEDKQNLKGEIKWEKKMDDPFLEFTVVEWVNCSEID